MSNYLSDLITRIATFLVILACFGITLWQGNFLAAFFLGLTTLMLAAGCLRDFLNWRMHRRPKKRPKTKRTSSQKNAIRAKVVKSNYRTWRRQFRKPRPKSYLR